MQLSTSSCSLHLMPTEKVMPPCNRAMLLINQPFPILDRTHVLHLMSISDKTPSLYINQYMEWDHHNSNTSNPTSTNNNLWINLISKVTTVSSQPFTLCNQFRISKTSGKTLTTPRSVQDPEISHSKTISSLTRNSHRTHSCLNNRCHRNQISIPITNKALCRVSNSNSLLKMSLFNTTTQSINHRSKTCQGCRHLVTLWSLKTKRVCWNLGSMMMWCRRSLSRQLLRKSIMSWVRAGFMAMRMRWASPATTTLIITRLGPC